MAHEVRVRHGQLEIEHIEKLALDPANVTLSKYTRADGPVDVFQRGIVEILERKG